MESKKIIIGAGRHAVEIYYLLQDIQAEHNVMAFAVDSPLPGQQLLDIPVISISELITRQKGNIRKPEVLVAVGNVSINRRLAETFRSQHFPFFSVIDKNVIVERQRFIGDGVTIATGSILTCNISIGNHVIINIGCTISHDCTIGNHVNISPGSHLAGNVTIEDDVFLGVGVNIIPNIRIGKGSVIAAGACVTKDVPAYSMVAGIPAVLKKSLQ